jgi:hypothetical protein
MLCVAWCGVQLGSVDYMKYTFLLLVGSQAGLYGVEHLMLTRFGRDSVRRQYTLGYSGYPTHHRAHCMSQAFALFTVVRACVSCVMFYCCVVWSVVWCLVG